MNDYFAYGSKVVAGAIDAKFWATYMYAKR
jgi:hypothetical protein